MTCSIIICCDNLQNLLMHAVRFFIGKMILMCMINVQTQQFNAPAFEIGKNVFAQRISANIKFLLESYQIIVCLTRFVDFVFSQNIFHFAICRVYVSAPVTTGGTTVSSAEPGFTIRRGLCVFFPSANKRLSAESTNELDQLE